MKHEELVRHIALAIWKADGHSRDAWHDPAQAKQRVWYLQAARAAAQAIRRADPHALGHQSERRRTLCAVLDELRGRVPADARILVDEAYGYAKRMDAALRERAVESS